MAHAVALGGGLGLGSAGPACRGAMAGGLGGDVHVEGDGSARGRGRACIAGGGCGGLVGVLGVGGVVGRGLV